MYRIAFLFAFLMNAHAQEGLLDRISNREKAVPVSNQTLTGTWMLELRPPGAPAALPSIVTYFGEGTVIGPTADGNLSASQGVWVRVADRKFLQTMYIFIFDEKRAMTNIQKVRINLTLSADGQKVSGTAERVLLDREGKELQTVPGLVFAGSRLAAEKPADFAAFLEQ